MSKDVRAIVAYDDPYIQPIILESARKYLPFDLDLVENEQDASDLKAADELTNSSFLQIRAYECLDFDAALGGANNSKNRKALINSYVIRKALIRKHYLGRTLAHWLAKNPTSCLKQRTIPGVNFELDYVEFLDEALLEAYELHDAFARNEQKTKGEEKEWWILKPGMSDRGQGIRLFSSEHELASIFEEWEAQNDSSEEEDDDTSSVQSHDKNDTLPASNAGLMTSHLRHFVAQPYLVNPLVIPDAPFNNRKFHIRVYVVAYGALQVFVFDHKLALFASTPFEVPKAAADETSEAELHAFRNIHLTNTCVQTSATDGGEAARTFIDENSVFLLSDLPLPQHRLENLSSQINETVAELFRAAVAQPTDFQPLPNAFELFGIDFLVTADHQNGDSVWLLEVNSFPDFAQTGERLKNKVVQGLFDSLMADVVAPHFGATSSTASSDSKNDKNKESGLKRILEMRLQLD